MNSALKPMSREAFIAEITRDVPETPRYYLHSRDLNKAGPALDTERPMPPRLTPGECADLGPAGRTYPGYAVRRGVRRLPSGGRAPREP